MTCSEPGCEKPVDREGVCFRHRVVGIGFRLQGSATNGSVGFHRTKNDFMLEHFGTTDDRELGKRGIERAT